MNKKWTAEEINEFLIPYWKSWS